MWQVKPLYYFHIKLLFLFCEAINIRCHGMASDEETFTKALGKRYSGEEGPIRRGDRIYKNKNSWQLMGPDHIYWKDFHRGWTQRSQAPLCKDNLPLSQLLMAMHHITALAKSGNWFQWQSLAVVYLFPRATGCFQVQSQKLLVIPLFCQPFLACPHFIHVITDHQETVCLHTTPPYK